MAMLLVICTGGGSGGGCGRPGVDSGAHQNDDDQKMAPDNGKQLK